MVESFWKKISYQACSTSNIRLFDESQREKFERKYTCMSGRGRTHAVLAKPQ